MTATWCVRGLGLLLTGLALASAAIGDQGAGDKKPVVITEKDKDARIKARKGDTVLVKLPTQGGTGFLWVPAKEGGTDRLKQVGKYVTEKPEKPKPGGKVTQVYRYTAEAAGPSELEFHYKRPFEKDKAPAKTFKVTVQVE